ncbi:DUF397 domain-containing protein [Streptomyces sp. NPDC005551]|uniref:DUF397 domain-containing protein n=1 Tax=Streptomyces sp. NPDC005551 TaxID=3364725 RepID=UPI0036B10508
MPALTWQKSSYCPEGNSCVHVARDTAAGTIRLTESGDPTGAILTAAPDAFRTFLRALKSPGPAVRTDSGIRLTTGDTGLVHLCETGDPGTVVTTTQEKWDAFVRGVRAGEFDHFAQIQEEERS